MSTPGASSGPGRSPASGAVARAAAVLGDRARREVALGPLTTYRVGGPAALFLEATDDDDLHLARRAVAASGVPLLVLGRGSNLLVADAGFAGLVVTLGEPFSSIRIEGPLVRSGGATSLPVLARRTAAASLTGLEWAVGVPGSVGGAVRMNAGGHGSDTARTLVRAHLFDLSGSREAGLTVEVGSLRFGYRQSTVGADQVVVWAEHRLEPGDRATSEAQIADIVRWRREHQPGGQNAGSVFTNPPGESAGRLVESAGLKGWRLGSARVSSKHANFILADEGGSADDVRRLIEEVQRRVAETTGVELRPELKMVGFEAAGAGPGGGPERGPGEPLPTGAAPGQPPRHPLGVDGGGGRDR